MTHLAKPGAFNIEEGGFPTEGAAKLAAKEFTVLQADSSCLSGTSGVRNLAESDTGLSYELESLMRLSHDSIRISMRALCVAV